MIKKELVVDGYDIEDMNNFKVVGHIQRVIEISDMDRTFLNHQYTKNTLMTIHKCFWIVDLDSIVDYCGG
jgi:hypothetical protein